jgi:hypothetical protein
MNITKSTEPDATQLNFDDVSTHTLTVTITEVKEGTKEQPVEVHVAEFPGRPYKPGKSMRRVLVAAWGPEGSEYVGRRLTLYGDPTIRFGKDVVGGVRISHLSHLAAPLSVGLTISRGKRAPFIVQPLLDDDTVTLLAKTLTDASTVDELQEVWLYIRKAGLSANPDLVALKDARKTALTPTTDTDDSAPDPVELAAHLAKANQ